MENLTFNPLFQNNLLCCIINARSDLEKNEHRMQDFYHICVVMWVLAISWGSYQSPLKATGEMFYQNYTNNIL